MIRPDITGWPQPSNLPTTNECTCPPSPYPHTTAAGPEISRATLLCVAEMETCPVEKRAIIRVANEIGRRP